MERTELLLAEMTEGSSSTVQAASAAYTAKLIGRAESEVPMVSMDGEAHPNMTLAAVGLGALVALIILLTLIAFITRRERSAQSKDPGGQGPGTPAPVPTGGTRPKRPDTTPSLAAARCPPVGPGPAPRCVTFANDFELADVVVTRM
ncbi:uncharacterized protein LOC1271962 [Anopheles gambiae]|uniref:Uncharacterized protein n=1 Tax=Anopheles coluzzii TaxID=1518534 RepID=A0A6E8V8G4_ANOCL|nr:uncharacterized protein LOC120950047 [Anopheles coluzzii]XP_061513961.1 uncharacterized protein LOC1271962 [Anopheles gambiae]